MEVLELAIWDVIAAANREGVYPDENYILGKLLGQGIDVSPEQVSTAIDDLLMEGGIHTYGHYRVNWK